MRIKNNASKITSILSIESKSEIRVLPHRYNYLDIKRIKNFNSGSLEATDVLALNKSKEKARDIFISLDFFRPALMGHLGHRALPSNSYTQKAHHEKNIVQ